MSQFPTVKAKDFIKVIEKLGFYFDRQTVMRLKTRGYMTTMRLFRLGRISKLDGQRISLDYLPDL